MSLAGYMTPSMKDLVLATSFEDWIGDNSLIYLSRGKSEKGEVSPWLPDYQSLDWMVDI